MRRLVPFLAFAFVLAGCGAGETVSPTGEVEGTLPTTTAQAAAGDAGSGKTLFTAQGCGGCHTFKPAGSGGTVGPDLDKLTEFAQRANQGPVDEFAKESIVSPHAYVEQGFPDSMPDFGQTLSQQQVVDLVAFLTENQKQG
jgi:mono/diheme cytochrome c family protein